MAGKVVKTTVLAALAAAVGVRAEWEVLYQTALLFGVTAVSNSAGNTTVMMTGSVDNSGTDILRSDDGGTTWTDLPHDQQALYLSIDSVDGFDGVAGSLGFWGQTAVGSVTVDGQLWTGIDYVVNNFGNGTSFLVGFWLDSFNSTEGDGVMASFNGGNDVGLFPWGQVWYARYGSFPTLDTWYISGGTWPAKKSHGEEVEVGIREVNERFTIRQEKDTKRVSWTYNAKTKPAKGDANAREPGYEGIIARTTNGGQTFETLFADSSRFYFNGIDCPDVNTCWAVAEGPEGGWILHSSDAGQTWTEQFFIADGGFFQVKMVNKLQGWAAGGIYFTNTFDALFVSTQDGGVTWNAEPVIKNAVANALDLTDLEHAYATTFLRVGGSSLMGFRA